MAEYAITGDIATLLGGDHTPGDPAAMWLESSEPILVVDSEGRTGGKVRVPLNPDGTFTVTGLPETTAGSPLYRLHVDSLSLRLAGRRKGMVTGWFPLTTNRDLPWIVANYVETSLITAQIAANVAAAAALGATNDTATASFVTDSGSATATALANTIATAAPGRGEIALSIHDYDPNPASIATVLDNALTDGAATNRTVLLGQGTWTSAKAGKHQIKSFTGLVGDPSGGTILQLTHAAGGLNIQDTAGTGGIYVYESRLRDLWINGMGVCANPVTAVEAEEMEIRNVRIQGWTDAGIVLNSASLALLDRVAFAGDDTTLAKPALRLLNDTGSLEVRSPNFYKCHAVELAGTGVTDMRFTGLPWFEDVARLVDINSPGNTVSATIRTTGRVISPRADMRLLRLTDAGAVYGAFHFSEMTVSDAALTSPLFDLSAMANPGVMAINFRDSQLSLNAAAPVMLSVNAGQAYNTLIYAPQDLMKDNTGQVYYDTAKWAPTTGYVTGGQIVKPYNLRGNGTPEAAHAGPVGSTFQRFDLGQNSLYRKVSGNGKTGWQPIGEFGPVKTVTATYTATYEDAVILGNHATVGFTITLPSAGSYNGRRFTIKNIGAATVTVGATVDGTASPTLAQWERMTVVTDGVAWRRID